MCCSEEGTLNATPEMYWHRSMIAITERKDLYFFFNFNSSGSGLLSRNIFVIVILNIHKLILSTLDKNANCPLTFYRFFFLESHGH